MRFTSFSLAVVLVCAACSGRSSPIVPPPPPSIPGIGIFDESATNCTVSYDGFISYTLPSGSFSPIDVRSTDCKSQLGASQTPPIPKWAIPSGPTQAIFVAVSVQQGDILAGMQRLETVASAAHVSMTWLIGSPGFLQYASYYNQYHAQNGDDVETGIGVGGPSIAQMQQNFPWYVPQVAFSGAGPKRDVGVDIATGFPAFWGITWDSRGIDGTADMGAPWGEYCANPFELEYKRPDPTGNCSLLAYEWTARDLTRAYLSGLDYWFSTDPDDLLQRAGFGVQDGAQYDREMIDAYAAAGQGEKFVVMSQQESSDETAYPVDDTLMSALYGQAVNDGMKIDTFANVNADIRPYAAAPRAIAFPYIPGGNQVASDVVGGNTLYPATIDYHDATAGMTFLAGHTMPTRVFEYAADGQSQTDVPLQLLPSTQMPTLTGAAVSNGRISFAFQSLGALHYGVALWTDPAQLGLSGSGVTPAGHAGVVLTFDLQPGSNTVSFPCARCERTTFAYST